MIDTTTHYGAQSTPSTSVGCSPLRQAEQVQPPAPPTCPDCGKADA